MNDLEAPPVPRLSDHRVLARQQHLVGEIQAQRRHHRRSRVAFGGAGLVASGATASALLLVGAGAPPAFAAWTAAPTAPAPGQVSAAEARCEAGAASPPSAIAGLPTRLTLVDTRGPFALLLFGENTATRGVLVCMSGPDGTAFSTSSNSSSGHQPAPLGPDQITLERLLAQSINGKAYTVAEGSVGSSVSAVTLHLSNDSQVVTTIGNGLFLAWWPGDAVVTSATLTTPGGRTTQAIASPPIDRGKSGRAGDPFAGAHSQSQMIQRFCAFVEAHDVHLPGGPLPCGTVAS